TKELNYTDDSVKPDTEYTYTVKVDNKVSKEKEKEIKQKIKENNTKLTKEEKEEVFNNTGTISSLIKTPNNTEESLKTDEIMEPMNLESTNNSFAALALPSSNEFSLDYRTFIPFKSVENPNPASSIDYLQGDNRTAFAAYSNIYRTESSVNIMFNGPTSLTLWKDVHASHSCTNASCSNPKSLGTASSSGITIDKLVVSSKRMTWSVNHAVGVPLGILYPDINYYYLATLTPKSFSIDGEHDKAPNHEVYLNYPSGSIKLHTFAVTSQNDFWKLIGVTASWSFDM
ncbi:Protein of unknown function, partial [Bacillus sp. OV322]|uniref:DUF3238 domain-containing protein n=1 Tax=Bacillus sp. OV322 TaxID=1882764 RepID=UPI0008E1CFEF